jgi:ankyrin repeat protein
MLLKAGADRNQATADYGTTPLWIAARKGHAEVVRLLLEASADRNRTRNRKRNRNRKGNRNRQRNRNQAATDNGASSVWIAASRAASKLLGCCLRPVLSGTRLRQIVRSFVHYIDPRRAMSKSTGCFRQFPNETRPRHVIA